MNGAYTDNEVLVDNFSNENCRSESNLNHNPHSSDDESSTQNRNQASREIHGFQELHISDHPPGYYDIYPDASRDMGTPPPYENQSNNGSFSTASNVSSNEEGIQVTDREPLIVENDIEDTQL